MRDENVSEILVEKSEEQRPAKSLRSRLEDNIKMQLKAGCNYTERTWFVIGSSGELLWTCKRR
jgi:hypothetical protein